MLDNQLLQSAFETAIEDPYVQAALGDRERDEHSHAREVQEELAEEISRAVDEIEAAVKAELDELQTAREQLASAERAAIDSVLASTPEIGQPLARVRRQIAELEAEQERLIDFESAERHRLDDYRAETVELKARVNAGLATPEENRVDGSAPRRRIFSRRRVRVPKTRVEQRDIEYARELERIMLLKKQIADVVTARKQLQLQEMLFEQKAVRAAAVANQASGSNEAARLHVEAARARAERALVERAILPVCRRWIEEHRDERRDPADGTELIDAGVTGSADATSSIRETKPASGAVARPASEGGTTRPWFEDLPLDFSRKETRSAEQLLVLAYPTSMDALYLAADVGLNQTSLNQGRPLKFLIREILTSARASNRLTALIAEALRDPEKEAIRDGLLSLVAGHETKIVDAGMRDRPSLATLAWLPPAIEAWSPGSAAPQPITTPGLEKTINEAAGFADVGVFRMRLAEAALRTARIDIGGKAKGTGFLVGDSLLLTCWHIVAGAVASGVATFDHDALLPDGRRSVAFADDWLVAHSAYASAAVEASLEGPPEGRWDFALIRLAEPVGSQAIGSDSVAVGIDRRGCYVLDGGQYEFAEAEPLLVVGHPTGRPIQLSYASPSQVRFTERRNRVRYQTNTENGSSGSPVFNRDWRVVALHHAAGTTNETTEVNIRSGEFNQGIPIAGIVAELKRQLVRDPALSELGLA